MVALITKIYRNYNQVKNTFLKHSFFHCEGINLVAKKGFKPLNKKWGLPGIRKEPSGCLGFPIALTVQFAATIYPFNLSHLGADCGHATRTSGRQKSDNEGLIFLLTDFTTKIV